MLYNSVYCYRSAVVRMVSHVGTYESFPLCVELCMMGFALEQRLGHSSSIYSSHDWLSSSFRARCCPELFMQHSFSNGGNITLRSLESLGKTQTIVKFLSQSVGGMGSTCNWVRIKLCWVYPFELSSTSATTIVSKASVKAVAWTQWP